MSSSSSWMRADFLTISYVLFLKSLPQILIILTFDFVDFIALKTPNLKTNEKWRLNAGDESEKLILFSADVSYNVKAVAVCLSSPYHAEERQLSEYLKCAQRRCQFLSSCQTMKCKAADVT